MFLRECKKSIFEGGIRVPGIIHAPFLLGNKNLNITTPVNSVDILPTIMDLLQVASDNPDWAMDGMSLLPLLSSGEPSGVSLTSPASSLSAPTQLVTTPRPAEHPLTFWFVESQAIIDNDWKLVYSPHRGQCDKQAPYEDKASYEGKYFLFNLADDIHELYDLKLVHADIFENLFQKLESFIASVNHSQQYEVGCTPYSDDL
jgi:arylsulfatase A-like enzyme